MAARGDFINVHHPEGHDRLGIVVTVPENPSPEDSLLVYTLPHEIGGYAASLQLVPARGKREQAPEYGWEELGMKGKGK